MITEPTRVNRKFASIQNTNKMASSLGEKGNVIIFVSSTAFEWSAADIVFDAMRLCEHWGNQRQHLSSGRKWYLRMNWINTRIRRLIPVGHCTVMANRIPEIRPGASCGYSLSVRPWVYIFQYLFSNPLKIRIKWLEKWPPQSTDEDGQQYSSANGIVCIALIHNVQWESGQWLAKEISNVFQFHVETNRNFRHSVRSLSVWLWLWLFSVGCWWAIYWTTELWKRSAKLVIGLNGIPMLQIHTPIIIFLSRLTRMKYHI